ncbi:MAG: hypothetical protein KF767_02555 [Bdellovibrionaceae bacterium]|nr:hypothetical protein [Pseudobdellovibrionaceae bacterium]
MKQRLGLAPVLLALPFVLSACSSAELKQRQEVRDRVVKSSGLYCEFMNGDANPDIDVAVNIAMGAKCDADKDFSITSYRSPSEINGVMFCCAVKGPKPDTLPPLPSSRESIKVSPKTEDVSASLAPTPTPVPKTNVRVTPNKAAPVAAPTGAAAAPAAAPAKTVTTTTTEAKAEAKAEAKTETKTELRKPNQSGIQFEADPEAGE